MFDKTAESRIAVSDFDRHRASFQAVVSGGVLHEIDSKHGPLKTKGSATRKFNPKTWRTRQWFSIEGGHRMGHIPLGILTSFIKIQKVGIIAQW